MPAIKKKKIKKALKKKSSTIIVFEQRIAAKDTLFPEKVANAKRILRNTDFTGSGFGTDAK